MSLNPAARMVLEAADKAQKPRIMTEAADNAQRLPVPAPVTPLQLEALQQNAETPEPRHQDADHKDWSAVRDPQRIGAVRALPLEARAPLTVHPSENRALSPTTAAVASAVHGLRRGQDLATTPQLPSAGSAMSPPEPANTPPWRVAPTVTPPLSQARRRPCCVSVRERLHRLQSCQMSGV